MGLPRNVRYEPQRADKVKMEELHIPGELESARWQKAVARRYVALLKEYATLAGLVDDSAMLDKIKQAEQEAQEATRRYEAVSKRAVRAKKKG